MQTGMMGVQTPSLLVLLFLTLTPSSAQHQFHIRYAITENQSQDMRIGKLDEDLLQMPEVQATQVFALISSSKYGQLKYQLREPSEYFHLHEVTSTLTTSVTIDLEALCPRFCKDGAVRAQLTLIVNMIHDTKLVAVVYIEVSVIDVDDNPPQFPSTIPRPYVLQFKEVIYRKGQHVELPKAIDRDIQPDHSEISYRLEKHPEDDAGSLDVFRLERRNDSRVMLVLLQDLDYETIKQYRFYLVAWSARLGENDGKIYLNAPQPHFQDRLEIVVQVLNINDIEPVFPEPVYSVIVSEDTTMGSVIFTFKAIDKDENSTIQYSLEGTQEPSLDVPIEIQPNGHVTVVHALDFEQRTKYTFTVRASDGEFFALTRLELTVTDVNDEPPEFVTSPKVLQVEENTIGQTKVGQLFIIDRDTIDVNGQVTCHEPHALINKQPLIFVPEVSDTHIPSSAQVSGSIEHRVYQRFSLYTRTKFDRETPPHMKESLLVCSDGEGSLQTRRLTSTLSVMLTVRDQNDNPPLFEKVLYEAELKENCAIGTRVLQVHASDADSEYHAKPRYKLLENELFGAHFDVEPENGWIYTKANIDRETQNLYQLTVLAIDGQTISTNESTLVPMSPPTTQHTASTQVHIRILDDNDNAPEFRGPRQFAVEENQPAHKWIGDLQVLDRDEGVNREIQFEMSFKQDGGTQTQWDLSNMPITLSKNGSLYTTKLLDRENQSHYCFEVVVRDQSPVNALSSADTICVRVLDMNDNPPQIVDIKGSVSEESNTTTVSSASKSSSVITVPISVHEAPGYCALIVEATDADEGRNALLQYGFNMTEETTLSTEAFMMDTQSGRLMLTRNLNFAELGPHSLKVTVEDSGVPSLRIEKLIYIVIEDKPARGNWLLPEIDSPRRFSGASVGDLNDAHTILIVIGLAGVSAFLAAALISAILCMIRPCRNGNRRRRHDVPAPNKQALLDPMGKCVTANGNTSFSDPRGRGHNDYAFSILNGNGYIETVDETMNPRGMLIPTAPIPGFDQVFLPSDKLIGVDSQHSGRCSIESSTLAGSTPGGMSSPTIAQLQPIGQYTLAQPLQATWIQQTSPHSLWTPLSTISAAVPSACGDCQLVLGPETDYRQVKTSQAQALHINQNAETSTNGQQCFNPPKTSYNTFSVRVNPSELNGERHGSGEEQRSDSGRGASDEEVPSLCLPTSAISGLAGRKPFHTVTLRTIHDKTLPHGVLFPSLPRITTDPKNAEIRLTTFSNETTPSNDNLLTGTQKPNMVRIPNQGVNL